MRRERLPRSRHEPGSVRRRPTPAGIRPLDPLLSPPFVFSQDVSFGSGSPRPVAGLPSTTAAYALCGEW